MGIDDYVRMRIQDSISNGVAHLGKEFNGKFEDFSCITIESLVDWNNEIHCNMQRAESYSIDHMYWWSLNGHLTDIIKHAKLLYTMKYCRRCGLDKPAVEFSKNKRKAGGLQTYCKPCSSAINAGTYKRLPKRRSKIRERNKAWVLDSRKFLDRIRRMFGCRICGENEPVALDFHHTDPTQKDSEASKLVAYSREKLKEEIRKCVILCSNCHRKHHAGIEGFKL